MNWFAALLWGIVFLWTYQIVQRLWASWQMYDQRHRQLDGIPLARPWWSYAMHPVVDVLLVAYDRAVQRKWRHMQKATVSSVGAVDVDSNVTPGPPKAVLISETPVRWIRVLSGCMAFLVELPIASGLLGSAMHHWSTLHPSHPRYSAQRHLFFSEGAEIFAVRKRWADKFAHPHPGLLTRTVRRLLSCFGHSQPSEAGLGFYMVDHVATINSPTSPGTESKPRLIVADQGVANTILGDPEKFGKPGPQGVSKTIQGLSATNSSGVAVGRQRPLLLHSLRAEVVNEMVGLFVRESVDALSTLVEPQLRLSSPVSPTSDATASLPCLNSISAGAPSPSTCQSDPPRKAIIDAEAVFHRIALHSIIGVVLGDFVGRGSFMRDFLQFWDLLRTPNGKFNTQSALAGVINSMKHRVRQLLAAKLESCANFGTPRRHAEFQLRFTYAQSPVQPPMASTPSPVQTAAFCASPMPTPPIDTISVDSKPFSAPIMGSRCHNSKFQVDAALLDSQMLALLQRQARTQCQLSPPESDSAGFLCLLDEWAEVCDPKSLNRAAPDSNNLGVGEIVDNVFSFLTAGFETAAHTMTMAAYHIAANPQDAEVIHKEIQTANSKHLGCPSGEWTVKDIQSLKHLTVVLKETLRLYPPVLSVVRFAGPAPASSFWNGSANPCPLPGVPPPPPIYIRPELAGSDKRDVVSPSLGARLFSWTRGNSSSRDLPSKPGSMQHPAKRSLWNRFRNSYSELRNRMNMRSPTQQSCQSPSRDQRTSPDNDLTSPRVQSQAQRAELRHHFRQPQSDPVIPASSLSQSSSSAGERVDLPTAQRVGSRSTLAGALPCVSVPRGTPLSVDIVGIQLDERVWGADVLSFCTHRWKGASKSNGWMPFGLGTKACLGQTVSMLEMKTCLAVLLSRFRIELATSTGYKPYFIQTPTLRLVNGLRLIMIEQDRVNPAPGSHG